MTNLSSLTPATPATEARLSPVCGARWHDRRARSRRRRRPATRPPAERFRHGPSDRHYRCVAAGASSVASSYPAGSRSVARRWYPDHGHRHPHGRRCRGRRSNRGRRRCGCWCDGWRRGWCRCRCCDLHVRRDRRRAPRQRPAPFAVPLHWPTVAAVTEVIPGVFTGVHVPGTPVPVMTEPMHWYTVAPVGSTAGALVNVVVTVTAQITTPPPPFPDPLHCCTVVTTSVEVEVVVAHVPAPAPTGHATPTHRVIVAQRRAVDRTGPRHVVRDRDRTRDALPAHVAGRVVIALGHRYGCRVGGVCRPDDAQGEDRRGKHQREAGCEPTPTGRQSDGGIVVVCSRPGAALFIALRMRGGMAQIYPRRAPTISNLSHFGVAAGSR